MKSKFYKSLLFFTVFIAFASQAQDIPGWRTQGDANWSIKDGIIQANQGAGLIITPAAYKDFTITLEFWRDQAALGGIFFRCSDPDFIDRNNSFKVNINDINKAFPTGSIVAVAKALKDVPTVDKWNTCEITAKGNHLTVKLNNVIVVDTTSDLYKSGPIALQRNEGQVKFRNIKIKSL